jgi:hypothetical protein
LTARADHEIFEALDPHALAAAKALDGVDVLDGERVHELGARDERGGDERA